MPVVHGLKKMNNKKEIFMIEDRKEFQKVEIEIIKFDKKDDIKTDFSSITLSGASVIDDGEDN